MLLDSFVALLNFDLIFEETSDPSRNGTEKSRGSPRNDAAQDAHHGLRVEAVLPHGHHSHVGLRRTGLGAG